MTTGAPHIKQLFDTIRGGRRLTPGRHPGQCRQDDDPCSYSHVPSSGRARLVEQSISRRTARQQNEQQMTRTPSLGIRSGDKLDPRQSETSAWKIRYGIGLGNLCQHFFPHRGPGILPVRRSDCSYRRCCWSATACSASPATFVTCARCRRRFCPGASNISITIGKKRVYGICSSLQASPQAGSWHGSGADLTMSKSWTKPGSL